MLKIILYRFSSGRTPFEEVHEITIQDSGDLSSFPRKNLHDCEDDVRSHSLSREKMLHADRYSELQGRVSRRQTL